MDTATLRLFSVDLEVLFSKDPFLKGDGTITVHHQALRPAHLAPGNGLAHRDSCEVVPHIRSCGFQTQAVVR